MCVCAYVKYMCQIQETTDTQGQICFNIQAEKNVIVGKLFVHLHIYSTAVHVFVYSVAVAIYKFDFEFFMCVSTKTFTCTVV